MIKIDSFIIIINEYKMSDDEQFIINTIRTYLITIDQEKTKIEKVKR